FAPRNDNNKVVLSLRAKWSNLGFRTFAKASHEIRGVFAVRFHFLQSPIRNPKSEIKAPNTLFQVTTSNPPIS
ncbi:MAG: hypothetical protein KAR36_10755, partial [Candidatus Latescibacteria bacterium]|nr:hypothetical protein [Candidatus Latescibacterota bacterium]